MSENKSKCWINFWIGVFVVLCLIFLGMKCNSERRAEQKVDKVMEQFDRAIDGI